MSNTPTKHSYLAASAAERWLNCPGSAAAAAEMPSQPSKYTAEGTVAHSLINKALLLNLSRKEFEKRYLNTSHTEDEFVIQADEEMLDAAWVMVEEVRKRVTVLADVHLEETVSLSEVNDILFMTPDVVIEDMGNELIVMDYKHGAGKRVSAWENKQLMMYGLARFLKLKIPVKTIRLIIVQPRLDEEVKEFVQTPQQMLEFKEVVEEGVKLALQKDAPRKAGVWCKSTFCPAFAVCEEAQSHARSLVAQDFKSAPEPKDLKLKKIKEVLDAAEFITGWLDKVKDHAKETIIRGGHIPGYKLIQGWGHRKYVSEEAIIADFGHIGEDLYDPRTVKSPAKLEKVVGKGALDAYVFKPETGLRLVPEDHKEPAVKNLTAAEDFKTKQ